jgi:hypothetical protein
MGGDMCRSHEERKQIEIREFVKVGQGWGRMVACKAGKWVDMAAWTFIGCQ